MDFTVVPGYLTSRGLKNIAAQFVPRRVFRGRKEWGGGREGAEEMFERLLAPGMNLLQAVVACGPVGTDFRGWLAAETSCPPPWKTILAKTQLREDTRMAEVAKGTT